MHVKGYLEYRWNDSKSPQTPPTSPDSSSIAPTCPQPLVAKSLKHKLMKLKNIRGVLLLISAWRTWKWPAKAALPQNTTHVSIRHSVVLTYGWKMLKKMLGHYSRWNRMSTRWMTNYKVFAQTWKKCQVHLLSKRLLINRSTVNLTWKRKYTQMPGGKKVETVKKQAWWSIIKIVRKRDKVSRTLNFEIVYELVLIMIAVLSRLQ